MRTAVFVAILAFWLAMMFVMDRRSALQIAAGEATVPAVFTDEYEPNLIMSAVARGPGMTFTGEATRITHYPYEGRAVVYERARATGTILGQPVSFAFEIATRWDDPDGFVMAESSIDANVAGMFDRPVRMKVTRSGKHLLVNLEGVPENVRKTRAVRVPEGVDLSAGVMAPAKRRPVVVGARWQLQSVGLSDEIRIAEVRVVEKTVRTIGGMRQTAYRAVMRTETATGRYREYDAWYDREGRALKQTLPVGPIELTLERRQRFVPDDDQIRRLVERDRADTKVRTEEPAP
jgi:hypothetical protein